MLVVSDTSPINYLVLLQQETLLPILYERVVIPPAVHEELQRFQTPEAIRQWIAHPPGWLSVQRPQQSLSVRQFPRLDDGELEAIPLAQKLRASFLLMDDFEGREEAGRRLVIVRDNGHGISKENLEKVFDPFFTTKAPGQGMGLGLGICYRIIQGFGGTIRVKSEPGEFCEFTLDLPAHAPNEKEA